MPVPQPHATTIDEVDGLPFTARNTDLGDLADILKEQQGRKLDAVVPAKAIRSEDGLWIVEGTGKHPVITPDGVTPSNGVFRPTDTADGQIAYKLGIPATYLRKLRTDRPDLYDANVNGWLHGPTGGQADTRSFLLRGFRTDADVGIARAFLSDRYRMIDHLDVLVAILEGTKASGADIKVRSCDLTERTMYVKFDAPKIAQLAPDLLGDYRSPFTGKRGADNPTVFAGIVAGNSETGGGASKLVPRIIFEVCDNGMTISKDALRNVHLGAKLDAGVITWTDATRRKNLDLIRSQATDAVSTFLDIAYVRTVLDGIREQAGHPVEDADATVRLVASQLSMANDADAILNHFIRGGDMTAGGVMNAITSYAQTVPNADRQFEIEDQALAALATAVRVS